nr:titin homolog isoform X4 [Lepeophtheirus salmonis]
MIQPECNQEIHSVEAQIVQPPVERVKSVEKLSTIEKSDSNEPDSNKVQPQSPEERSHTFFIMPTKEDAQIKKTKVLVDIKKMDTNVPNPFEDSFITQPSLIKEQKHSSSRVKPPFISQEEKAQTDMEKNKVNTLTKEPKSENKNGKSIIESPKTLQVSVEKSETEPKIFLDELSIGKSKIKSGKESEEKGQQRSEGKEMKSFQPFDENIQITKEKNPADPQKLAETPQEQRIHQPLVKAEEKKVDVIKTKAETDFDILFSGGPLVQKETTEPTFTLPSPPFSNGCQITESMKKHAQNQIEKLLGDDDENRIEVIKESNPTQKYSDRKSSYQEYDEDQNLIYDPEDEKLAERFVGRYDHLLHEEMPESIAGEEVKLSKKERKEMKKLEKEKKKADKVDKEQTLKQEKLQAQMEKQMIAKEKKDLLLGDKERKKAERDRLKHEKEEEKKTIKLEKEELRMRAKFEKEQDKQMAKLEKKEEKKKKTHKRNFFKILQKKGKAKSLSDLNENDPLIIKDYNYNEEEEEEDVIVEEDTSKEGEEKDMSMKKDVKELCPETKEEEEKIIVHEELQKEKTPGNQDSSSKLDRKQKYSNEKEGQAERQCLNAPINKKVIHGNSRAEKDVKPKDQPQILETSALTKEESITGTKTDMAASVSSKVQDDFAAFSNPGGNHNSHHSRLEEEEEIDFTPQNGYILDEQAMEDLGYIAVEDEDDNPSKKKRKSRERRNFKAGLQKSVGNFNSKIRSARLPSPHELKEGYMNSNLHKSFQQPLVARARVEKLDVQKARALLVKHNTPSELAKMKHPLDIPLPKFGGGENKPEKPPKEEEPEKKPKENGFSENHPPAKGGKMYQTLPRSWRETQLITAVKENGDPEMMAERQELVKNKTPAELAQLHSITDFPVPSRLANLFHPPPHGPEDTKNKNQSSTSLNKPKEPFKMETIIPSSLRETKLITNVREITDEATLKTRQDLVQNNTPGELSKFRSLSDFPVPTRIENIFKPRSRSSSVTRKNDGRRSSSSVSVRSKSLTRSWSGTIPRSWRETQLLTGVKVDPNQEEIIRRRALIENTSPAELSKITSVADLPVPTALQNIFSGNSSKSEKEVKEGVEKSSKPMNLEEMYNNLPRSLKTELLVKSVENDQELTKKRQKMVESMKPKQLAQIGSLSEFPVPSALENIFKEKDSTATPRPEKRARNKTVIGLMTYENLPEGLKKEVLVRSKVEDDPEVLEERREAVRSKTPAELSRISGFSDFPLPEKIEGFVRPGRRNLKSTKQKDMAKKRSKSWSCLTNPKELYNSLPQSLKSEVLVSVKVEDDEVVQEHKKLIEQNSVAELGKIHGVSDFPIPDKIVNLMKTDPNKTSESRPETPAKSLRENFMDAMPESLKSEVLVRTRNEDPDLLKERQELTRSKTPNELSQISSLSDFPIPTNVENMFKKKEYGENDDEPIAPPRKFKKENLYESLPNSLKTEVLVRSKIEEDPEVLKERQELVRSRTPAELSEIHGFDDIPIPSFLTKRKDDCNDQHSKKDVDEDHKTMYEKMPDSLKTEMLVRARVETPEIQKERSELVKKKTVKELSEIHGLDDIPIPNIQFLKRKDQDNDDVHKGEEEKNKTLYEQIPDSLKTEVLVRSCVEDPQVQKENADLLKSKSVKELSQIHGISDFPLPTRIEYAVGRKPRPVERRKKFREKQRSQSAKNLHERMYESIPQSLRTELLVKSLYQDPSVQMEGRRLIQSKSVGELSQIHGLSDFPIPYAVERLISMTENRETEGSSLKRMSLSSISLSRKSLYSALPKSLTAQELRVRSRIEKPEVLKERRELVKTKSVSELATLNSISDFPIPSNVERFIQNRRSKSVDQSRIQINGMESSRPTSPIEKLKDSIPSSMKTELLVSSSVQDPEVSYKRKQLTESTSVHELSQLHGISDFPVPEAIENFVKGRISKNENRTEDLQEEKHIDLYASLPKSLKQEVLVRSLVEENDEEIKKRQALVETKSPAELSQIHSFSEIPVPSRIEAWLSSTDESKLGHPIAPPRSTRSFHELRDNMYETLPKSLKEPTLVRTKVEDPDIQKNRSELTRSKTPSQLAEIHGINELPIPGLWNDGSPKKNYRSTGNISGVEVPKTKQEIKDYVYKTLFPESLVRPCIVRSKVEDQSRLLERQAIQQSKTIHELSKINNLSDFPLPGNIKLPPIPFPSTKGILKIIAPSRKNKKNKATKAETPQDAQENQYNQVDDSPYDHSGITDDEMLRYESSTPAESMTREQDFGYEIISAEEEKAAAQEQERYRESDLFNIDRIPDKFKDDLIESPSPILPFLPVASATTKTPTTQNTFLEESDMHQTENEDSQLVDHYRGTPPRALGRSKMKNKKNRLSQDSVEQSKKPSVSTPSPISKNDICLPFPESVPRWMPLHEYKSDESPRVEPTYNPKQQSTRPYHAYSEVNKSTNHSLEKSTVFPPMPTPRKRRILYQEISSPHQSDIYDEIQTPDETFATPLNSCQGEHVVERIQSRPLPAPPTPIRSRGKTAKKDAQTGTVEIPSTDLQSSATNTEVFHTVQSSLDQTLVQSRPSYEQDDETLADSVVDSMHSCAETLVDEDATLHEDLRDEDIFNNDPYPRTGSVEERLKNETQELSRELLEHVENLRTTLGNMSTRLGTTSPEPPPRK